MARKPSRTTRVKTLLKDIPDSRINEAKQLIEEILMFEDKLNDIKKDFIKEEVVDEYDNGGGQTGIRENPTHLSYQRMLKTYTQLLSTLEDMREHSASSFVDCYPSWCV